MAEFPITIKCRLVNKTKEILNGKFDNADKLSLNFQHNLNP